MITIHEITGTIPVVLSAYTDWFLPSKDLLKAIYDNLWAENIGKFGSGEYWSSTSLLTTTAEYISFVDGSDNSDIKSVTHGVLACRSFVDDAGLYELGDMGPAGGLICYIDDGTTYYEAYNGIVSASKAWSNVTDQDTGSFSADIDRSAINTALIVGQTGHTTSAAKLCVDLIY